MLQQLSPQALRALADELERHSPEGRQQLAERRSRDYLEELHRSQAILDATFEGIYGLDLDGCTTFVNRAAREQTGWSADEMIGRRQHDVVHHHKADGSLYPAATCPIYATLRDGRTHDSDTEVFWRKDGTSFPVAYTSTPVRDPSGELCGAVVSFRNISAQRSAEREREKLLQRLEEERLVLQLVLAELPVGVWILDERGQIVHGNPASLRIWEGARFVSPHEYGQYRGWWADTGRRIEAHEWAATRAIQQGETTLRELIEIETFQGNCRSILNSAFPIHDHGGRLRGAIIVNEDVSAQREEERLRKEWNSVIAHDLRQPVNVIALGAELLELEAAHLSPTLASSIAHIKKSARALERLIGDLLDVSRLAADRMALSLREIDPRALVREVVDRLAGGPLDGRPVRLELNAGVAPIVADPGRLEQVLGNLLTNAVKYGDPKTEIVVRLHGTPDDVYLEVTNRGPGIPAEEQGQLFRRFQRTRDAERTGARGVGLGLYIAKGLVEAHGGRIWVDSTPGETTTFHVALPARPPRAKRRESAEPIAAREHAPPT